VRGTLPRQCHRAQSFAHCLVREISRLDFNLRGRLAGQLAGFVSCGLFHKWSFQTPIVKEEEQRTFWPDLRRDTGMSHISKNLSMETQKPWQKRAMLVQENHGFRIEHFS